ncbi:MAG: hypothetical protein ACLUEV_01995 [Alistipes sp.]
MASSVGQYIVFIDDDEGQI